MLKGAGCERGWQFLCCASVRVDVGYGNGGKSEKNSGCMYV